MRTTGKTPGNMLLRVFFIFTHFSYRLHTQWLFFFFPAILHVNVVAKLWNPLRRAILLCLQNIYIRGLVYDYILKYFSLKISLTIPYARPLRLQAKSFSDITDLHSFQWVGLTFCFSKHGKTVTVPPLMCFLSYELLSSVCAHMCDFKCKRRRVGNRFSPSPSGSCVRANVQLFAD